MEAANPGISSPNQPAAARAPPRGASSKVAPAEIAIAEVKLPKKAERYALHPAEILANLDNFAKQPSQRRAIGGVIISVITLLWFAYVIYALVHFFEAQSVAIVTVVDSGTELENYIAVRFDPVIMPASLRMDAMSKPEAREAPSVEKAPKYKCFLDSDEKPPGYDHDFFRVCPTDATTTSCGLRFDGRSAELPAGKAIFYQVDVKSAPSETMFSLVDSDGNRLDQTWELAFPLDIVYAPPTPEQQRPGFHGPSVLAVTTVQISFVVTKTNTNIKSSVSDVTVKTDLLDIWCISPEHAHKPLMGCMNITNKYHEMEAHRNFSEHEGCLLDLKTGGVKSYFNATVATTPGTAAYRRLGEDVGAAVWSRDLSNSTGSNSSNSTSSNSTGTTGSGSAAAGSGSAGGAGSASAAGGSFAATSGAGSAAGANASPTPSPSTAVFVPTQFQPGTTYPQFGVIIVYASDTTVVEDRRTSLDPLLITLGALGGAYALGIGVGASFYKIFKMIRETMAAFACGRWILRMLGVKKVEEPPPGTSPWKLLAAAFCTFLKQVENMEQDVRLADATVVKVDDTISGANMYSDGDPGSMKVEQAKSLHDEEEIERAKKRLITMQKRGKNDGPGASQQNEADGTGTTKQNVPPGELEDLDDHGTKASTIMPDLMEEDE